MVAVTYCRMLEDSPPPEGPAAKLAHDTVVARESPAPSEAAAGGAIAERTEAQLAELPIILYDGQCGLCHHSVAWLLRHDRGRLYYAPLQGPTAERLRARHPAIPHELESVVYVWGGRAHLRSKAFLHVARHLTWPWRWAYVLRFMPAFVLDPLYRLVARYRYRWFGHYDECRLPTTQERQRLLP